MEQTIIFERVFYRPIQRALASIFIYNIIILARTPEIGQGLGRILSCGARKQEQT